MHKRGVDQQPCERVKLKKTDWSLSPKLNKHSKNLSRMEESYLDTSTCFVNSRSYQRNEHSPAGILVSYQMLLIVQ